MEGGQNAVDGTPQPQAGPSGVVSDVGSPAPPGTPSITEAGPSNAVSTYGSSVPATPATEYEQEETMQVTTSTSTSETFIMTVGGREINHSSTTSTVARATASNKRKANAVKAAAEAASKKKQKKKDKDDEEDEDYQMEIMPAVKARYADRKPGSFAMCAECNKKVSLGLT